MVEVDVRGQSCPIPVLRVKDAIEQNPGEPVKVITDCHDSYENVSQLARNKKMSIEESADGDDLILVLKPA